MSARSQALKDAPPRGPSTAPQQHTHRHTSGGARQSPRTPGGRQALCPPPTPPLPAPPFPPAARRSARTSVGRQALMSLPSRPHSPLPAPRFPPAARRSPRISGGRPALCPPPYPPPASHLQPGGHRGHQAADQVYVLLLLHQDVGPLPLPLQRRQSGVPHAHCGWWWRGSVGARAAAVPGAQQGTREGGRPLVAHPLAEVVGVAGWGRGQPQRPWLQHAEGGECAGLESAFHISGAGAE